MKILAITILTSLSFGLFAQSEYNYMNWYYGYYDNYFLGQNIFSPKDGTVELTETNLKNNKVKKFVRKYNEEGKLLTYGKYVEGSIQPYVENKYDAEGHKLEFQSYKKGKLKKQLLYTRNEEGKMLNVKHLSGKGKLQRAGNWSYTEDGCVKSSTLLKSDGETIKRIWEYAYYEECKKSKSTLKKGNGKLIKEWTYDCKEEGEVLQKKKDVTQVCKWEEVDKDYLIKVTQTFSEKGKIIKNVAKYRSSDTSIVSSKRYNHKEELVAEYTYDHDFKKPLKNTYYKNGAVRSSRTYSYDGDKLIGRVYQRKGKQRSKITYEYDSDDRLTAYQRYEKEGELSKKITLQYN